MSQQQRHDGPSGPSPLAGPQNGRDKIDCVIDVFSSHDTNNTRNTGEQKGGVTTITGKEYEPDETSDLGEGDGHAQEGANDKRSWLTIWKKCPRDLRSMLPLGLCLLVPILVGLFAAPDAAIGASDNTRGVRIVWFFTWLEVVWCSLWVSKLFAKAIPIISRTIIRYFGEGAKKYASVIAGLETPISLVGWAIASLSSFLPLMTRNPDQRRHGDTAVREWQRRTNLALISCLVSAIIYLVEKLIIQIVTVDYRHRQFDHRIKICKKDTLFLSQLYKASGKRFPRMEEFRVLDNITSHPAGSATLTDDIFRDINSFGNGVARTFRQVMQEAIGHKYAWNQGKSYRIVSEALEEKESAEALAEGVWKSCTSDESVGLTMGDLLDVVGRKRKREVSEHFLSLDRDGNGNVSLEEIKLHVTNLRKERRSVEKRWHNMDSVIRALDSALLFIVLAAVVLVFVIMQQSNVGAILAGAAAVFISLSFIFTPTAQEIFCSYVFLFVKNPFDTGDCVDINGKRFLVKDISLLYTEFKHAETHKTTQVPNSVLSSLWIENISRSARMRDRIKLWVNYDTPSKKIEDLRKELQDFVMENSREFHPKLEVELGGTNELGRLEVDIEVRYKGDQTREALTGRLRNTLLRFMVETLKELRIHGVGMGDPSAGEKAKPMFTVAISDGKAHDHMDEGAKKALRRDQT